MQFHQAQNPMPVNTGVAGMKFQHGVGFLMLCLVLAGCAGNPWLVPEERPAQRPVILTPAPAATMPSSQAITEVHTQPSFQIKVQGKWLPLKNREDFLLQSAQKKSALALTNSPWVFVGYGITAPALGWDNYRNLDVVGKTVIMLAGAPAISEGAIVDSRALILHPVVLNLGQWQEKIRNAERHGAALALIVHDQGRGGWEALLDFPNAVSAHPQDSNLLAWGWVPEARFKGWLQKAGVNWDRLKAKAQATDFVGMTLPLQSSLTLENRWQERNLKLEPGSQEN